MTQGTELMIATETAVARRTGAMALLQPLGLVDLASRRPRDLKAIGEELEELAADKDFAAAALYCKPCGKDDGGVQTFARGLSIRAAEAIFSVYGNAACAVVPYEDNEERAEAIAGFFDAQHASLTVFPVTVSKFMTTRDKKRYRIQDDRFWSVVFPAKCSIAKRNAILAGIPAGLKQRLTDAVNRTLGGLLDTKGLSEMLGKFKERGVDQALLEGLVGRPLAQWNVGDRIDLLGIWTSLRDGDVTVPHLISAAKGDDPAGSVQALIDKAKDAKEAKAPAKKAPAPEKKDPASPAPAAVKNGTGPAPAAPEFGSSAEELEDPAGDMALFLSGQ